MTDYITRFLSDHVALARWIVARYPNVAKRAVVALAFRDGDSERQFAKLASYALFELNWIERRERPLTTDERNLRSIADRIFDNCESSAQRLGIHLWPEDFGPAYERTERERAYERAINHLDGMKETRT